MLTREELEKMIKNGETVWYRGIYYAQEIPLDCNCYVDVEHGLCVKEDLDVFGTEHRYRYDLEHLYKTREDAEWKFKTTAVREERFEPPTWEEFKTKNYFNFYSKNHTFYTIFLTLGERLGGGLEQVIRLDNNTNGIIEKVYSGQTKENYTEAVELARKLFLGEKV